MKDFEIKRDGRGYAVWMKGKQLVRGFRSAEAAVKFLVVYKGRYKLKITDFQFLVLPAKPQNRNQRF